VSLISKKTKSPQVVVSQIGRREHYAIPLALQHAGMLAHFFTDGYVGKGSWLYPFARMVPDFGRRGFIADALTRRSNLPGEKVSAFNLLGCLYTWRLLRCKSQIEANQVYLWCAQQFNHQILKRPETLLKGEACYALSGVGLELFQFAKSHGLKCIINQIDPSLYGKRLLAEESALWPDWESQPSTIQENDLFTREQEEWHLADLIIVNSSFTQQALTELGALPNKIQIVPLAVDCQRFRILAPRPKSDRVKFLFLGTLGLGKGIQYALQAMGLLKHRNIQCIIAGRADFKFRWEKVIDSSDMINYIGHVPGNEVVGTYQQADVFLFPTVSDGFGLTQLEAMACGLPVITTPNCASIVRDGIDGFIVPIRDPEALAAKMELLVRDRELLAWMSRNARERALEFSWEKYQERLVHAVTACWLLDKAAMERTQVC
jgi:glycosyltransferase involved in cell wall biosynthesis